MYTVKVKGITAEVKTLKEAVKLNDKAIEKHLDNGGHGASDFGKDSVINKDGKFFGRISWNGRIWNSKDIEIKV
jgi:hypothetical protein